MSEVLEEMEVQQEMSAWKGKVQYNTQYNQDRTTTVNVRLNYNTDADILAYLQTISNKQGLIKELLRSRMSEDGFVYTPPETEENN